MSHRKCWNGSIWDYSHDSSWLIWLAGSIWVSSHLIGQKAISQSRRFWYFYQKRNDWLAQFESPLMWLVRTRTAQSWLVARIETSQIESSIWDLVYKQSKNLEIHSLSHQHSNCQLHFFTKLIRVFSRLGLSSLCKVLKDEISLIKPYIHYMATVKACLQNK